MNLQFCSLVINYDLPWNPQRVEQRIGRCHRYGQKHDVVVINFLNERNDADKRVLELLTEKFNLFSGVFGASDEVLGSIESGADFERRILAIYQECRTPEEIDAGFAKLRVEMDAQIQARMLDTRKTLLEHFDEDVHERLRLQLADARDRLDRFGRRFWTVTRFMLGSRASFDDVALAFDLHQPPIPAAPRGRYHLISKSRPDAPAADAHPTVGDANRVSEGADEFLYRLSHPLGEHVIDAAKRLDTPVARVIFDVTHHPARVVTVEGLKGRSGALVLTRLRMESFEVEEHLLFSGFDDEGRSVDPEILERLFACGGRVESCSPLPAVVAERLDAEASRSAKAAVSRALEQNNRHFAEARDKLERWAEDMVLSAEKALRDTKEQIKALSRESRQAATMEAQHEIQQRIQKLERQQRRQRQDIFKAEDDIMAKRNGLIDALERRLAQASRTERLFVIAWRVK